jgi:hypothetical protein
LFDRTFMGGCTITLAVLRKARKAGLEVGWIARLLPKTVSDAYYAAIKPACDAYDAATKPARDAYYAAIKPARDAYYAAIKTAWDAYDAAIKPARDAYDAAVDRALVAAFRKMGKEAKQYPSDLEREADVALAEEVFGE